MSNVQSWLLLFLIFGVLYLAVYKGGQGFDRLLDLMFTKRESMLWTDDDDCPCGQDRSYHDRKASQEW